MFYLRFCERITVRLGKKYSVLPKRTVCDTSKGISDGGMWRISQGWGATSISGWIKSDIGGQHWPLLANTAKPVLTSAPKDSFIQQSLANSQAQRLIRA